MTERDRHHHEPHHDEPQHSHGHHGHHGHQGHHHDEEFDWDALGPMLERHAEVHLPFLTRAVEVVSELAAAGGPGAQGEPGSGAEATAVRRVLDVGSGPGVTTALLARAFPGAEVVAVDGAPALLERARARAEREGLGDRVRVRRAELPDGVADLGEADVIWAGMVVHHFGDQQAALAALAARLRPGGLLAVVEGGLPTRFLPRDIGIGRPGLAARVDAAEEEWFAEMRAALPGAVRVAEDWPALLAGAGLVPEPDRSFVVDRPAPLEPWVREHVHTHLARRRERMADRLDAEDLRTLDLLLDRDAPAGVLHRPDVFFLTASTVHIARRPLDAEPRP
ncbi:class I SAM-dependent methyltransferase [Streptomyces sp. URMC 123]|uniref:class I SAM-dependent methyltransferase n=1 Tax=Streptomyces sp. URMC 123 TaxID=3423403 RepID=UPI003F1A6745